MIKLYFYISTDTYSSEIITNEYKKTEVYYKELSPADNSLLLKIPYEQNIATALKVHGNENIKAVVKDGETILFTGYLRKNYSFSKTTRNQAISLELVTPSFLLNKNCNTIQRFTGQPFYYVIDQLLLASGLYTVTHNLDFFTNDSWTKSQLNKTIDFCVFDSDKNYYDCIKQLCFEAGCTFNFSENGDFQIYPLFNEPGTVTQAFNNNNMLEEVTVSRSEESAQNITGSWNLKKYITNSLIFSDTTNGDDNNKCKIEIAGNDYLFSNEINYCEYDSDQGVVLWAETSILNVEGDVSLAEITRENLGTKLSVTYKNNSAAKKVINLFDVYGNAWVEEEGAQLEKIITGENTKEFAFSYLNTSTDVKAIVQYLLNYYKFSDFKVTVKSKTDYAIGTFVTVSTEGIGTLTCRIVQKKTNLTGAYEYNLEAVKEFETSVIQSTKTRKSSTTSNIFTQVQNLSAQISTIVTNATVCKADVLNASIEVDNDGYTQEPQSVSTKITLQQGAEELDFNIGELQLPTGWSYSISGNTLTFTVGENVRVKNGLIKIPVIYHPLVAYDEYTDPEGNIYTDPNGESYYYSQKSSSFTEWDLYFNYFGNSAGTFLGTFKTLAEIPTDNLNINDYFVWGGTNNTVTTITFEGKLLQARTYKYLGTSKSYSWTEDRSSLHGQVALGDILGIANADLKTNNSTVWQFLDHLTSNTTYTDMLVANEAFIEQLSAKIITADLVTTDVFETTLANYETTQDLIATLSNYVSDSDLATTLQSYVSQSGLTTALADYPLKTSLSNVASSGNYSDLTNKPDLTVYATQTQVNTLLNNYVQSSSIFGTDGKPLSVFATDCIANAIVNGQTVIANGFINTNCLNSDVVTTQYLEANYIDADEISTRFASIDYLEGGNATFKGTVTATAGRFSAGLGEVSYPVNPTISGNYLPAQTWEWESTTRKPSRIKIYRYQKNLSNQETRYLLADLQVCGGISGSSSQISHYGDIYNINFSIVFKSGKPYFHFELKNSEIQIREFKIVQIVETIGDM